MRVPVAHDQAVKAHLVADHAGQQFAAAMDLLAAHQREARHDRLHAGFDRRRIAGAVNVAELGRAGRIVALVVAALGAAVADEMLGGGDDMSGSEEFGRARPALQAFDHRARIGAHDLRILAKPFIGPAPPVVADHREGRREIPVDPGHRHLHRGDLADAADQIGIAHRAEPDILREDGRADDIGVAVNGVDAPHDRDGELALRHVHRRVPEAIGKRQPFARRRRFDSARRAVAAGEDRSETVAPIFLGRDARDVGLDDLRDLLLERHPREQGGDPRLDRRIVRHPAVNCRPNTGVGGRPGLAHGSRGASPCEQPGKNKGPAHHRHRPPCPDSLLEARAEPAYLTTLSWSK